MKKHAFIFPEKHVLPFAGLAVVLGLVLIAVFGAASHKPSKAAEEGRRYVAEAVSFDTAKVDEVLQERQAAKLAEQAAKPGSADSPAAGDEIWGMFKGYGVMGDSRAVGFSFHDFLDESRVIADGGHTIRNISDNIPAVTALQPSYIYICYGLNDTGIGYWDTGAEYAAEFSKHIDELRSAAPKAKIIVSSILPATEEATRVNDVWEAIPEFSAAAKKMCAEKGVTFVDCGDLAKKYMSTLWDEDGVHLKEAFYPIWAQRLLSAALGTGGAQ